VTHRGNKNIGGGSNDRVFGKWARSFVNQNSSFYSLYAVSAEVMKTSIVVTEPGTIILLSLGLAGLAFARYRKQS
jgi:hypothetical protein